MKTVLAAVYLLFLLWLIAAISKPPTSRYNQTAQALLNVEQDLK